MGNYSRLLLLCAAAFVVSAQPARIGGSGERILVAVPMVGAGTWADPRRPAMLREAGVAFRFELSDDGATAIAEVSPRGPLELKNLESQLKTDARAKVFRPSKDKQTDVQDEIRKVKKDFDIELFGKGASPSKVAVQP
ncbi:MAG: hypothetical protein ACKV2U_21955 [Bryobacteraceae bacterium]